MDCGGEGKEKVKSGREPCDEEDKHVGIGRGTGVQQGH